MSEQVLLPGEQLGHKGNGEGLERPVAGNEETEEPGKVSGDQHREGNPIEIASTNQNPIKKMYNIMRFTFVVNYEFLTIMKVIRPVQKSTRESQGEEREEVSPVFVALPCFSRQGGERLVEVSLSALRSLLLAAANIDGGKFQEAKAGQDGEAG